MCWQDCQFAYHHWYWSLLSILTSLTMRKHLTQWTKRHGWRYWGTIEYPRNVTPWSTFQGMTCRFAYAGQRSDCFEVKRFDMGFCCHHSFSFWLLTGSWGLPYKAGTVVYSGQSSCSSTILTLLMTWLSFHTTSHTTSQMQNKTIRLATKSAGIGLKINLMKTELIKINTTAQIPVIVGGEPIRKVESFIYLGSVVDTKAGTEHDIIFRLGKVRSAPTMLKNIWASRNICTYQNVDTQLQCKYCMEQRNDECDHNNCQKDQNILQHHFKAHLQHPLA